MTKISKVIFTFSIVFIFAGALGFAWVIGVPEMIEDYLERREPATIDLDLTEEEKAKIKSSVDKTETAYYISSVSYDLRPLEKTKDLYFHDIYEEKKEYIIEDINDWESYTGSDKSSAVSFKEARKEISAERKSTEYELKRFQDLSDRICVVPSLGSFFCFLKKDTDGKWKIEMEMNWGEGWNSLASAEKYAIQKLQEKDAGEK